MLRRARRELFSEGEYCALRVEGAQAGHLFAFARILGDDAVVVAVPRLVRTFRVRAGGPVTERGPWGDTRIILPKGVPGLRYSNEFTNTEVVLEKNAEGHYLEVGRLLEGFPVAILARVRASRKVGNPAISRARNLG
jgi:(1->4)-alpha-D-glucan 1-alpha-D-glucosylmutase